MPCWIGTQECGGGSDGEEFAFWWIEHIPVFKDQLGQGRKQQMGLAGFASEFLSEKMVGQCWPEPQP